MKIENKKRDLRRKIASDRHYARHGEFCGEGLAIIFNDEKDFRLPTKCKGPSGVLRLQIKNKRLHFKGNYPKRDPLKLLKFWDGAVPEHMVIHYSGDTGARFTSGYITLENEDRRPRAFVRVEASLMVSEDSDEIAVMIGPKKGFEHSFHKLKELSQPNGETNRIEIDISDSLQSRRSFRRNLKRFGG